MYEYDEETINYLATIAHGQAASWQYAMFDVTEGRKGLIFELVMWSNQNIALDDITLHDKTCSAIGM